MSAACSPSTRVLSQQQRSESRIVFSDFDFPDRVFHNISDAINRRLRCTLREKVYSRSGDMSCYLSVDDELLGCQNIILSVARSRGYRPLRSSLDMRTVPLGSSLLITLGQGSHHLVWLQAKYDPVQTK